MAKLKELEPLPVKAQEIKDRIDKDSAQHPQKQCKKCGHEHFLVHQRRPRWFLAVVHSLVCPILCVVCRWHCANCEVTFTNLPWPCVRFKRYLRVEIEERSASYVETDPMSYRRVVKDEGSAVVYDDPIADENSTEQEKEAEVVRELSASTVHRWISGIGASRSRLQPVVKRAQLTGRGNDLSTIQIAPAKYRSEARKRTLEACSFLLRAAKLVAPKEFTELATLGSSP